MVDTKQEPPMGTSAESERNRPKNVEVPRSLDKLQ